ncbi:50S ribosomal protein L23 [Candidatus Annandia adelgestsuga]|uniref:50S ribosomal protein L23 n=1 Tax=Candidatus Annandia adelgestsuga TaxID=1302411 RepID=A0A3Q9CLU3_9ENTR|nr:50S ribosomal protein L23 [Candidatus Annandia adelgestsuga]AZP36220.1 50S ribosomal protein L23 [Candidatus Annandia adelgestsuga]
MKKIEKKLYSIFIKMYTSEKFSFSKKNKNVFMFKVPLKVTKKDIKKTILQLFNIYPKNINTLVIKKKKKKKGKFIHYYKSWKKVYITFKKKKNYNM